MNRWRGVMEVARWEFLRYVKPKQQLIGMLFTVVIAGGFMLVSRLASRDDDDAHTVAIIGAAQLPALTARQSPTLRFTQHEAADEPALRDRVRERDLDALLIIDGRDHAELVLRARADWTSELRTLVIAARQQLMTEQAGLRPEVLAAIVTPPTIDVTYEQRSGGQRAGRASLIIVLALMLMAIFVGMSYIFTSITGEKQIRVTEQVVSAIPAQSWIDGKILGLVGVSVVGVMAQVISFGVVWALLAIFLEGDTPQLFTSFGEPGTIALIVLYAILGLFFWFAFLGAVAAMIDDPNTSTRGPLLFLPLFSGIAAFFTIPNPESGLSRVLALLPPTAPTAMPVRMLSVDVSAVEVVVSIALLIGGVLVLRVAAGRIFRLAMLMYGKEPSWSEVRRWALGRE